jgi:hypothetical protein
VPIIVALGSLNHGVSRSTCLSLGEKKVHKAEEETHKSRRIGESGKYNEDSLLHCTQHTSALHTSSIHFGELSKKREAEIDRLSMALWIGWISTVKEVVRPIYIYIYRW